MWGSTDLSVDEPLLLDGLRAVLVARTSDVRFS
jgi:hypothetical protein